jgi:hypothetical protein
MHSQHKNLIEKIKEVLPSSIHLKENGSYYLGQVDMKERVISSLPQVMEVIKGEIIVKINDSIIESDIVITHNKDILKIVDSISSKIITLLSEEDK